MANGKGKGSAFERYVSKILTKWLTGQDQEYYFWRSPGSGAVASVSMLNVDLSGDIIAVKPVAACICEKISIECKTGYPKADPLKCLKGNKNDEIHNFWRQACDDAKKKNPLLIFRKRGAQPIGGISAGLYKKLKKNINNLRYLSINWQDDLPELMLFDLNELLEQISPEDIRKL